MSMLPSINAFSHQQRADRRRTIASSAYPSGGPGMKSFRSGFIRTRHQRPDSVGYVGRGSAGLRGDLGQTTPLHQPGDSGHREWITDSVGQRIGEPLGMLGEQGSPGTGSGAGHAARLNSSSAAGLSAAAH
jgi:hypothetical protein